MTTSEDPPAVSSSTDVTEVTKASIREKTWAKLQAENLTNSPMVALFRIPHFKGAEDAAQRFSETEVFKKAKTISINADRAQEKIQFLTVQANKTLLVQIPILIRKGLVKAIHAPDDVTEEVKQSLKIRSDFLPFSKTVDLNADRKVDIVVMGSIAVSKQGQRIGKGEGFADLEYAMMLKMGMITPETIVVTTVHDSQVYDTLPEDLFKDHDVGVNLIVTPTQVIQTSPPVSQSPGILWHLLSNRRLKIFPILRTLHEKDIKSGETCDLKEEDSDVESRPRQPRKFPFRQRRQRQRSDRSTGGEGVESERPQRQRRQRPRPRQSKSEGEEDGTVSAGEGSQRRLRRRPLPDTQSRERKDTNGDGAEKGDYRPRKNYRGRPRPPVDFSLRVSNIASDVRVRDLKNALAECKVKPVNIKWRGQHGFALLHFAKMGGQAGDAPASVDSIMTALRDLKVAAAEGDGINVEPVNPVTRIEVTDEVTSV